MNILDNLKYSNDHEWVRVEGNVAVVGISDFAQSELGDIVFVDVTCDGETFGKDETFGTIEAVKTVSDLLMPVGGKVVEINAKLQDDPALINNDPYGEGWIVKIEMSDSAEVDSLLSAAQYKELINA